MSKVQNTFLTPIQFTATITSALIGTGLLNLPNDIMAYSKQDSWISCILGGLYPLYMVIIANYMCKKFPKDNILKLSKRFFGKFFGSILNLIFISFFVFGITTELAGFSYVFRIYSTPFLKSYQIFLAVLVPIAYISYKGIKPLARLNEIGFSITIFLMLLLIPVLTYGSILNLMPVFGSGLTNIVKGSKETALSYGGIEIIFLIYPFLQDKKKLLKCGLVGTAITVAIYTVVVSATIFYLGIETSPKYLWPILALADSINFPIINSFRFIFISIWAFVEFKCISTHYWGVSYSLNQSIKKISSETFSLLIYPLILLISLLYRNPTTRRGYVDKFIYIYVLFNLIFVAAVAILIYFKKGDNIEKI